MWGKIKKFSPLAVLVGFALVYSAKGWNRVLPDFTALTFEKITAKMHNIIVALVAGLILYFLGRMRLPPALTTVVAMILYGVIGYNIALIVDPPNGNNRYNGTGYVVPAKINPYGNR